MGKFGLGVLAIATMTVATMTCPSAIAADDNYTPRPLTSEEAMLKGRVVGLICRSPITPNITWRFVEANPGNNAVRVIYDDTGFNGSPPVSHRHRLYIEGNQTRFRGMSMYFSPDLSKLLVQGAPVPIPCFHG